MITSELTIDNTWGLDHGTWSVLNVMFPKADVPVYQLSIDKNAAAKEHFEIGKQLKQLREEGVLIIGSGNVVIIYLKLVLNLKVVTLGLKSLINILKTK